MSLNIEPKTVFCKSAVLNEEAFISIGNQFLSLVTYKEVEINQINKIS